MLTQCVRLNVMCVGIEHLLDVREFVRLSPYPWSPGGLGKKARTREETLVMI